MILYVDREGDGGDEHGIEIGLTTRPGSLVHDTTPSLAGACSTAARAWSSGTSGSVCYLVKKWFYRSLMSWDTRSVHTRSRAHRSNSKTSTYPLQFFISRPIFVEICSPVPHKRLTCPKMPTPSKGDSNTKDHAQMGKPLGSAYMVRRAQRGLLDEGMVPGSMRMSYDLTRSATRRPAR